MILTIKKVILWLALRPKLLAPFALVITLYNSEALVRFLDLSGQYRSFLFRREGLPIEGRVGPANMVVNRCLDGFAVVRKDPRIDLAFSPEKVLHPELEVSSGEAREYMSIFGLGIAWGSDQGHCKLCFGQLAKNPHYTR